MTGDGFTFDPLFTSGAVSRWRTQATQLRSTTTALGDASTAGLPASAVGAARTFLTMWENTSRKASVAADVYADELASTGTSYQSLDAEIARRMAALKPDAR